MVHNVKDASVQEVLAMYIRRGLKKLADLAEHFVLFLIVGATDSHKFLCSFLYGGPSKVLSDQEMGLSAAQMT